MEGVYEPAEDSFLLMSVLRQIKPFGNRKALDMGTGSGIQGLALARNGWKVTCSDISEKALDYSRSQFRKEGLDAEFVRSDLFHDIAGRFSLISFNPPYLPESGMDYEEKSHLEMREGLIEDFLNQAREHLFNPGRIYLVYSSLTGDVEYLIRESGYEFRIAAKRHIFFEDIFVAEIWDK